MSMIIGLIICSFCGSSSVYEYIALNKPFIVDIHSDRHLFDHLRSLYRFSKLQTVSNRSVRVSDLPYGKHYTRFIHEVSVSDYMTEQLRKTSKDMLSLFGEKIVSNNNLLRDVQTPLYVFGSEDVTLYT